MTKKIKIDKVTYKGYGLGYDENGKVAFVPYCLPEEEVEVKIIGNYAVGFNNIDIKKATEKKILSCQYPGSFNRSNIRNSFNIDIYGSKRAKRGFKRYRK